MAGAAAACPQAVCLPPGSSWISSPLCHWTVFPPGLRALPASGPAPAPRREAPANSSLNLQIHLRRLSRWASTLGWCAVGIGAQVFAREEPGQSLLFSAGSSLQASAVLRSTCSASEPAVQIAPAWEENAVCPSRKMSSFLWSLIHHPLPSRHLHLWLQAIHLLLKKRKIDSHKMPFSSKTNGKGPFGLTEGNPHKIPAGSHGQISLLGIQKGGSQCQKERFHLLGQVNSGERGGLVRKAQK